VEKIRRVKSKLIKEVCNMADKVLKCKDCDAEFIFSEGEQEFYKEKGFDNEPQRCPDCRRARKMQRNNNRSFGNRW
jgi:ssDNA-binding Zn-finger/Zn-ribbon topoisomerase 1